MMSARSRPAGRQQNLGAFDRDRVDQRGLARQRTHLAHQEAATVLHDGRDVTQAVALTQRCH